MFLAVKLKWAIQYFSRILCLDAKLEKERLQNISEPTRTKIRNKNKNCI
jgi:hypothetical protein